MTLRCTSLVPPAIVRQRLAKNAPTHVAASPSLAAPAAPSSAEADLLHTLIVLDAEQLADARLGTGSAPRQRARRHAQAEHRERLRLGQQRPDLVAPRSGRRASTIPSSISTPNPNDEPDPIDTRSLASVVRAARQPSFDRADDTVVGHEHVRQEHLVEHGEAR